MNRLMVRAACGLGLAGALGASALAQGAPDPAGPIPPQRLALAEQVVEASGAKANGARMMDAVANQIAAGMQTSANSALSTYVAQLVREELTAMEGRLDPLYAEVYARSFTDEELGQILAFYTSPTGKMLVRKMPEVLQQSQAAVMPLIPAMQRDMVEKLFDHICAIQTCTDAQRAQMAEAKAKALERLNQQAPAAARP